MKAALIHNPRSGYNRRYPGRVTAAATAAGIPMWDASNEAQAVLALRAIAPLRPDVVIVNGGDGTVDAVITALRRDNIFEKEPMISVLGGGSTNMIARDVGLSGVPEQALAAVVRAGTPGADLTGVVWRSPFSVIDETGALRLGFFIAGGALPAILRRTQERSHKRGFVGKGAELLTLVRATLRLVGGNLRGDELMHPQPVSWAVDEKPKECDELVFHFVTTLDRLVLGARPGQAQPSLRLLALRYPYRNVVGSIWSVLRGRPFHQLDKNMVFRSGRRLRISCSTDAVLDGEPLPRSRDGETEILLQAPIAFWRPYAR